MAQQQRRHWHGDHVGDARPQRPPVPVVPVAQPAAQVGGSGGEKPPRVRERINGGRLHGRWEGLARGNLHEGRDLPVLNDFRSVIAQALAVSFKLPESKLADIFPGGKWDSGLESLIKRGV